MTRRHSSINSSSLELLLDTICNTFGGIIFLAILVAVLLQMSGTSPASSVDVAALQEMVDLQARQATVSAELETLRRAVAQQDELTKKLINDEDRQNQERIIANRQSKSSLTNTCLKDLGEINGQEVHVGQIAAEFANLEARKAKARMRVQELENQLQAEIRARTTDARLPLLRDTDKREVPVFLVQGRLTVLVKPGGRITYNLDEFTVQDLGTGHGWVEPKSGAGLSVLANGQSHEGVVNRIKDFDKNQDYLAVFVWHDSFEQFRELRNAMVELGFEYRLVPIPSGQKRIQEGTGSKQVQ